MTLNNKVWKKAKVTKQLDDRSYEIDTGDDILRRNRVHLRKTEEEQLRNTADVWENSQTTEEDGKGCSSKEIGKAEKPQVIPRRSARSTKGKPPKRYEE